MFNKNLLMFNTISLVFNTNFAISGKIFTLIFLNYFSSILFEIVTKKVELLKLHL